MIVLLNIFHFITLHQLQTIHTISQYTLKAEHFFLRNKQDISIERHNTRHIMQIIHILEMY